MSKKRYLPMVLALILVLTFTLAACGQPAQESPPAEPAEEEPAAEEPAEEPAAEEPAAEGEAKIATFIWTQEFDTLNPLYTTMWFSSITQQLWDAWAWNFDENNEPIPVLVTEIPNAENGGISEDGRTITFNLRDDIVWSDGTPITAEDFVFTYEMTIDPANIVSSTYPYDNIESIEAPDPQTVVVTFAEPFAPWLSTLWHGILPAHVLRPIFEADGTLDEAEWNVAPTVGAGPYVFAEWESGSFARFVRNENYYNDPPLISEIFFRFVPDDASQTAALQTGDGDLGTFIAYSDVPTLEEAGVNILTQPSGYAEGWYFYLGEGGHPALQDVNVRQAIAYAIDRQTINEDLLLGLTQPATTLWYQTPYESADIEPWPYDPEQANALLDEAGWVDSNGDGTRDKDGVELLLTHGTTTREIRQDLQAVAQQQLAEVGIGLELQSFESSTFFAPLSEAGPAAAGELDIFEYSGSTSIPDPDTAEWLCSEIPSDDYPDGSNWMRFCDETLDGLFLQQATQTNVEERQQTFQEISQFIHDNVIWLGMWEDPDVWAVSNRLQNVRFSGVTPFFSIAEWDISE